MACQDVLGIHDLPKATPALELDAACGGCVGGACEAAARACAADAECASLAACAASHRNDPAGREACEGAASVTATSATYLAIDACLRGACQASCFGSAGLLAPRGAACDGCLAGACADETRACVASRGCERAVVDAYTGTMTPPKNLTVDNAVGDAGAPMRALDDCLEACGSECHVDGSDFACTGRYAWPTPVDTRATLEVEVSKLDVTARITTEPGALVDACSPRSSPCDATSSAKADPRAIATLEVAIPKPEAFRGYVRIETGAAADALFPMNLFIGHPLYADLHGPAVVPTVDVANLLPSLARNKAKRLPNRALIQLAFLDCGGRLASGVVAEFPPEAFIDADTIAYYPFAGAPPTGSNGQAILFNAAPGCFEIRGTVGGVERYRFRLDARADVLTTAYGFPESDPIDVGYVCTPSGG